MACLKISAEHDGQGRGQRGGLSAGRPDFLPVQLGPQQQTLAAAHFSGAVSPLDWPALRAEHLGGHLLHFLHARRAATFLKGQLVFVALPRAYAGEFRARRIGRRLAALGVVSVAPQLVPWIASHGGDARVMRQACAAVVVPMVTGWDTSAEVWRAAVDALSGNVPVFLVPDLRPSSKRPAESAHEHSAAVGPE